MTLHETPAGTVVIAAGREKPILNRHPWVFSGAITNLRGNPTPGDLVDVQTSNGRFLARGYWNPRSQIQVRILTWQDEAIDEGWWRGRLVRAVAGRVSYTLPGQLPMCRLVHAESDFLPGLIVDRYGEWAVLQALTLGIDKRKAMLAELLAEITGCRGVFERSDVDVRGKEGLRDSTGPLWGEEPPELVRIASDKQTRLVDLRNGHKTGYYLDQIPNQQLLADIAGSGLLGNSPRLLNLFSYTGGFGLANPGPVVNVDASRDVLELAEQIYFLNDFPEGDVEFIQGDVFDFIRDQVASGEQYDVVVCDPPKFAHNASQVEKAARGYKDLNLHSFKLVRPGGLLLTFSCSGAISPDLFQKIVFGALADSGRDGQILRHLSAGEDHPIALTFPEGEYLKGLLVRVY